ncbi:hypothetical protein NDU88_002277 [Pleurodeles waltl]|uniref:Uncharacterized protein n=1 Tax=Pleurodeles waltl TaxID=8319 RepID=A0AAV7VC12_PLEWA|nr:hypothetical protein NDU88_002277 [Pleurodeles waltl]
MSEVDAKGGEEGEEVGDVEESCLPRKKEEDEEVAAEERNTVAAPGGRVKNPFQVCVSAQLRITRDTGGREDGRNGNTKQGGVGGGKAKSKGRENLAPHEHVCTK